MKKNTKKFSQKIIIILCLVSLFNFLIPPYSNADLDITLINPIKDLVLLIADGAMGIMQGFTMGDYTVTQPSEEAEQTGAAFTAFARGLNSLTGGSISNIDDLTDIATIKYTPYLIFTNQIPTFDANFFNNTDTSKSWLKSNNNAIVNYNTIDKKTAQDAKTALTNISNGNYATDYEKLLSDIDALINFQREYDGTEGTTGNDSTDLKTLSNAKSGINEYRVAAMSEEGKRDYCTKYNLTTFPPLSDLVDILKPNSNSTNYLFNGAPQLPSAITQKIQDTLSNDYIVIKSTSFTLAPTISKWYSTLSILAIVSMISVLVYSGIRIIISSASKDKAKYKQMIVDWFVAICLLFFMRYIMSFSFAIVDKLISLLSSVNTDTTVFFNNTRSIAGMQSNGWLALGYTVIYVVLVCISIYFTFTYLKRVLYLAFLTMISPLVAFTYPIDKINDGKAQAFDMWLKEYLFNLLIQPLHLVLYSVLIGSASDLVDSNYLYAVIALAFMTPAEKLLRKFFGFEKAHTPGFLAGPAGGALMIEGFKKLTGWGPGSHNKSKGSSDSSSSSSNEDKANIPQRSIDSYGLMSGNSDNDTNDTTINIPMESESTSNEVNVPLPAQGDVDLIDYDSTFGPNDTTVNIPMESESTRNKFNVPLPAQGDVDFIDYDSTFGFGQNNTNTSPRNSTASTNNKKPNKLSRLNRAFDASTKAYGRGLKRKLKNYAKNEFFNPTKNIKSVGKVLKSAAQFGTALGTGALGLGIGLATGDPKQALQNAIIGGQAGSRLTGNILNKAGNTLHVDDMEKTFEMAYYGDDYSTHLQDKEYQKWLDNNKEQLIRNLGIDKYNTLRNNEVLENYRKNGKSKKEIIDEIGEDQYQELQQQALLKEYFTGGIDNVEEIIACEKFKDAHKEFDTDSAIGAMKIANDLSDKDLKKKKEILFENFKDKNPNRSNDDINTLVQQQLKFSKEIEGYKKEAY